MHRYSPISNPAGSPPLRRPDSIRRTSSIDVTWPEGPSKTARFDCRCRDIHTPPTGGDPLILAEDRLSVVTSAEGRIESIASIPAHPQLDMLLGKGHEDYLRRLIDELLPAERDAGSGLYFLLDDLPVISLISGWLSNPLSQERAPAHSQNGRQTDTRSMSSRAGVCIGFAPGSSALEDNPAEHTSPPVVSPLNPEDPLGFHALPLQEEKTMRRFRRIDVWRDGCIHIDSTFQDSATSPGKGRSGIHEYVLKATVDPETLALLTVDAEPRILPFPECQSATQHIGRLVGTPLRELRRTVPRELRRVLGCTHLNDALRALAEVSVLVVGLGAGQEAAAFRKVEV